MKTIDRKDLKTNELAEQLDHITVYAKTNMTRIAMWVGGIIAVGIAIFGYMNYHSSRISEGWAKLGATEKTDAGDQVREAREVAEANLSPALTTQAWLRTGVICLMQLGPSAPASTAKLDWAKTAEEAFTKVLSLASDDLTARGQALMSLGVLAENAGNGDAAKYYKQIVDDRRFDVTPFKAEAEFRMKGVPDWLKPVKIAAAPLPQPGPFVQDGSMPNMIPVDAPPPEPAASKPPAATPPASTPPATTPPVSPPPATTPPASTPPATPPAAAP